MGIFSILATPLGYVMQWIHYLIPNYGWTIIVFTLLVKVLLFPLQLKQQKSQSRMSAYQPMIQELQKKWANDKNRQNQELQKFYTENNIKMSAGCAPMIVNMLVLFGMIAVIQAPLTYVLHIPTDQVNHGIAIVQQYKPELEIEKSGYTQQSVLIGEIKEEPELFTTGLEIIDAEGGVLNAKLDKENVEKIQDFDFQFMGLNMAMAPTTSNWVTLIMPILSLLTMVASQLLTMFTSGQTQGRAQMWIMTVVFGVMFGFFAFTVPSGFSLYYTVSNIITAAQSFVLRKIYDPKKIREEVEKEIEERRTAKKAKKKVILRDESGNVVETDMSESELIKLRLAKAREEDALKYQLDESDEESEATRKARELDEKKYAPGKQVQIEQSSSAEDAEPEDTDAGEDDDADKDEPKAARPGRRRRARLKDEEKESDPAGEEKSFAQQELETEQKAAEPVEQEDEPNA